MSERIPQGEQNKVINLARSRARHEHLASTVAVIYSGYVASVGPTLDRDRCMEQAVDDAVKLLKLIYPILDETLP